MKAKYLIACSVVFLVMTGCKQTEKTEGVTAEIEAAQMQGREAARWLLNQDLTDSIAVKTKAEYARRHKKELEEQGKKEAAAAFDTAFVTTVRAVNPKLRYE